MVEKLLNKISSKQITSSEGRIKMLVYDEDVYRQKMVSTLIRSLRLTNRGIRVIGRDIPMLTIPETDEMIKIFTEEPQRVEVIRAESGEIVGHNILEKEEV